MRQVPIMRVGVLEWICGGGRIDAHGSTMASLRSEGWAMLYSAITQLDRSGIQSIVSIDPTRISQQTIEQLPASCQVVSCGDNTGLIPSNWANVAKLSDRLILVAPEFSEILASAVKQLSMYPCNLCNCKGEFLASGCDKWLTAKCFTASGIDCPPTQLFDQVSSEWLDESRTSEGRWIIKPRDGAGCGGIEIVGQDDLQDRLNSTPRVLVTNTADDDLAAELNHSNLLIQPYVSGPAFSRSAIIDASGKAHWMPLVTQRFAISREMQYLGGQVLTEQSGCYVDPVADRRYAIAELNQLLDKAIRSLGQGCLGWVGFDLVYAIAQNKWLVIEANPRLTTSFVGLSGAFQESLMEQIVRACGGQSVQLTFKNVPVQFNADGSTIENKIMTKAEMDLCPRR